jgi:hypothetical protein
MIKPKGCDYLEYKTIVNYSHHDIPYVDHAKFAKLSQLEQAALIAHEVVYYLRREMFGDKHSIPTRMTIAYLLAKNWENYREQVANLFNINKKENIDVCPSDLSATDFYFCNNQVFKKSNTYTPEDGRYNCKISKIEKTHKTENEIVQTFEKHTIADIVNFNDRGFIYSMNGSNIVSANMSTSIGPYGVTSFEKVMLHSKDQVMVLRSVNKKELSIEIVTKANEQNSHLQKSIALGEDFKVVGYGRCSTKQL